MLQTLKLFIKNPMAMLPANNSNLSKAETLNLIRILILWDKYYINSLINYTGKEPTIVAGLKDPTDF